MSLKQEPAWTANGYMSSEYEKTWEASRSSNTSPWASRLKTLKVAEHETTSELEERPPGSRPLSTISKVAEKSYVKTFDGVRVRDERSATTRIASR